jgi:hypothetical protein
MLEMPLVVEQCMVVERELAENLTGGRIHAEDM